MAIILNSDARNAVANHLRLVIPDACEGKDELDQIVDLVNGDVNYLVDKLITKINTIATTMKTEYKFIAIEEAIRLHVTDLKFQGNWSSDDELQSQIFELADILRDVQTLLARLAA